MNNCVAFCNARRFATYFSISSLFLFPATKSSTENATTHTKKTKRNSNKNSAKFVFAFFSEGYYFAILFCKVKIWNALMNPQ